jgi:hypothetical protein
MQGSGYIPIVIDINMKPDYCVGLKLKQSSAAEWEAGLSSFMKSFFLHLSADCCSPDRKHTRQCVRTELANRQLASVT